MADVRVKPLEWSKVRQPNDEIRYTHVVADSPLGRWSIEWKGWKDYDDRTVFLDGEFVLNGGDDLEEAQSATLARYESIIRSTLSDAVAEREAEPPELKQWRDEQLDRVRDGSFLTSTPTSELEALRKRVAELEKALEWYEEKVAGCRKLTKEGDSARADLDRDGGTIARRVREGGKVE